MPFDIKQLADIEIGEDEFYEYQDELLNLFANSPEGQARLQADDGMAFWAGRMIDYGYNYVGVALHEMDEGDVEELLTDVFPKKVSLSAPEDADEGLPAMIAFWEYLKREYQLENANEILDYLRSVKPEKFRLARLSCKWRWIRVTASRIVGFSAPTMRRKAASICGSSFCMPGSASR